MTQTQSPQLNEAEHKKAEHLAFLLAQSVMPQEQKEAWLNLLPIMLPEQVDQLMAVLEKEHQSYVASSTAFVRDLQTLESSLQKQITNLKTEERKLVEEFLQKKISEQTQQ